MLAIEPADQATGLRHLLRSSAPRIIAVISAPSAGRSAVCANLAVCLAAAGRRVLVLDCAANGAGAAGLLGVRLQEAPLDPLYPEMGLADFTTEARAGVSVVWERRTAAALARQSAPAQGGPIGTLPTLGRGIDWVLVDTAGVTPVPLVGPGREALLVLRADSQGLLDGYRVLKRLAAGGGPGRVLVLINHTGPGVDALRVFDNLALAAHRFLKVSLELVAEVPQDQSLRRASDLSRPVVEAFPGSPSGQALRSCGVALLGRGEVGEPDAGPLVHRQSAMARSMLSD